MTQATNALPDTVRLLIGRDTIGTQLRRDKPMTLPRNGDTVVWADGRGNICRASTMVTADTLVLDIRAPAFSARGSLSRLAD